MSKKDLLEDVFVTDAGKPYLSYVTEDEGDIDFAMITGKGIKLDPKNKHYSYKVSMRISKAEAKRINAIRDALWEEYKPKTRGTPDEPVNELVWEHPDTGELHINPHCATENPVTGDPVVIGLVDSSEDLNKLDPNEFKIGKGSTGHVNVNFTVYPEGVSMYLNAVQLVDYVPFEGGGGDPTRKFKGGSGKSLAAGGGKFKSKNKADEDEPKKKKKKKKKSKTSHQ